MGPSITVGHLPIFLVEDGASFLYPIVVISFRFSVIGDCNLQVSTVAMNVKQRDILTYLQGYELPVSFVRENGLEFPAFYQDSSDDLEKKSNYRIVYAGF